MNKWYTREDIFGESAGVSAIPISSKFNLFPAFSADTACASEEK
jgi:hypothetical protein